MNLHQRQDSILLGFLLLSLLLHLLLLYLLPQREWLLAPLRQQPMVVELRPPEPSPKPRELDLPVRPAPEAAREQPARRLGPSDQRAERERAPKGDAPEDRRPGASIPPTTVRRPAPALPPASAREPVRGPPPQVAAPPRDAGPPTAPETAVRPMPETKAPSAPVPDLKSLLQLPEATVARLDQEWRRKYRPDVERGDAVWLDTEKDLLISFFQRFRTNIYGVWNYPVEARDRGEEGTCLLKVTVNRDGTLQKVQLMESSGSSALDEEAMTAVRKASPYGALPRSFEEEALSIFAFFEYRLTRRIIYGQ